MDQPLVLMVKIYVNLNFQLDSACVWVCLCPVMDLVWACSWCYLPLDISHRYVCPTEDIMKLNFIMSRLIRFWWVSLWFTLSFTPPLLSWSPPTDFHLYVVYYKQCGLPVRTGSPDHPESREEIQYVTFHLCSFKGPETHWPFTRWYCETGCRGNPSSPPPLK